MALAVTSLVPRQPGNEARLSQCYSFLMALVVCVFHPSIHLTTLVCNLHTSLQLLPTQVAKDETLASAGCIPSEYKDKFQFWAGLMLVVCSIPLAVIMNGYS